MTTLDPMPAAGPITLGVLIAKLRLCHPNSEIRFGFGYFAPMGVDSYRGDYSQLAVSYKETHGVTVACLLNSLEAAVGHEFEGYKGGEYVMRESTPVWAANWGEYTRVAIVGVARSGDATADSSDNVLLLTAVRP